MYVFVYDRIVPDALTCRPAPEPSWVDKTEPGSHGNSIEKSKNYSQLRSHWKRFACSLHAFSNRQPPDEKTSRCPKGVWIDLQKPEGLGFYIDDISHIWLIPLGGVPVTRPSGSCLQAFLSCTRSQNTTWTYCKTQCCVYTMSSSAENF